MSTEPSEPTPQSSHAFDQPLDDPFDVAGYLMRARRSADLSQRELSAMIGVSQSALGRWEAGTSSPRLGEFVAALACAHLRLQVVDEHGAAVQPFGRDGVRDNAGRRYPAHLDVLPPDLRTPDPWWGAPSNLKPSPGWCVQRRSRDLLRNRTPPSADHPTGQELTIRAAHLARREAERRAEQSAAIRARRSPRPEPEPCFCPERCIEVGLCVPECECRCD
ncbi:helix-turn-helix domain-containing protein [Flexivirga sp. B27]